MAATDARRGGAVPSAALDAARGFAAACQRARPRARRRDRAHAAGVACQSSAAPAGDRHRRCAQTIGTRPRGCPGLPHGGDSGRQIAEPEGDRRLARGTDSLVLLRGKWVEIDRERLERSIRQFRDVEFDVLAITDEIYEHILYDGTKHIAMASLDGMRERTVTINGMSKTYSVTGWRVGWAIAPKKITNAIRKVHDFLTVGAPAPLQEAGAVWS